MIEIFPAFDDNPCDSTHWDFSAHDEYEEGVFDQLVAYMFGWA